MPQGVAYEGRGLRKYFKVTHMNLLEYRKSNFISVKQASEELGISRQHIYDIEKGKSFPSRKLSIKICKWSDSLVNQVELLFPDLTKSVSDSLVKVEKWKGNESRSKKRKTQGTQTIGNDTYIEMLCSDKERSST
ncbi:MAG: helix-turn-helix transcriptional regulator [Deltaproteobacteria bacterium]|nr:helix-turn-helix transcriptional regulator [Deltaproteobacteria bacterium]